MADAHLPQPPAQPSNGKHVDATPASTWKYPALPVSETYTPGVAPIKKQFILPHPGRRGAGDSKPQALPNPDDDAAESRTGPSLDAANTVRPAPELANAVEADASAAAAPVKLKGAARKRARREEAAAAAAEARNAKKQKQGGQNKNRQFFKTKDTYGICGGFLATGECRFERQCKYSHDLVAYLADKARDIYRPQPPRPHLAFTALTPEERDQWLVQQYSPERIALAEAEWTHVKAPVAAVPENADDDQSVDPAHRSIDLTTSCPIFSVKGFCDFGWKCRFLGAHVKVVGPSKLAKPQAAAAKAEAASEPQGTGFNDTGLELVRDEERIRAWRSRERAFIVKSKQQTPEELDQEEVNYGTTAAIKSLKTRKYPLPKTKAVLEYLEKEARQLSQLDPSGSQAGKGPIPLDLEKLAAEDEAASSASVIAAGLNALADGEDAFEEMENALRNHEVRQAEAAASAAQGDMDVARIRPSEKRRLNWRGELYLAPLTTTGNLPFRRICSNYGSDIHCGEMGLAESFLHGNASEWSLVRRWEGERIFGTQLCGGKPNLLIPVAEALKKEVGDGLDFVDLNCGCPIDLVYNKGAGSALLDRATMLSKIVRGMNAVLGETPLTIKLRTGTTSKQTTHKLFARLQTEWGVSAATLHGRSRKQRYKNFADWGYIKTCADTLRESVRTWNEEQQGVDAEEMVPIPIYGNGDVYSWQDYYERLEMTGVDGEMIARGALIKPWLFTEIKERRDWDISSRERLDMIRQYASYGLSHWGSDTQGVNTTRRFLCEMLSFTHRYVPTGILEHLPARMNDRPPPFKGRDELETLLASGNSEDWVRISEMFLGKAPGEWSFVPKHKSNSYAEGGEELQG
ncbi:tRNA-dihydrouridine synthase 3 [Thecaphora frezii]